MNINILGVNKFKNVVKGMAKEKVKVNYLSIYIEK
jgi:hypothetical protein